MILSRQKVDHAASYRAQVLPKYVDSIEYSRIHQCKSAENIEMIGFYLSDVYTEMPKTSRKGEYASFHHVPFLYTGTRASGHIHKTQILQDWDTDFVNEDVSSHIPPLSQCSNVSPCGWDSIPFIRRLCSGYWKPFSDVQEVKCWNSYPKRQIHIVVLQRYWEMAAGTHHLIVKSKFNLLIFLKPPLSGVSCYLWLL